jgi:hypothetical protein
VPLEPETKEALHGLKPELAWLYVLDQVAGAVEEHYTEAEQIRQECGLHLSLMGLQATLEQTIPEDGLNLLLAVRPQMDLSKVPQMNPLTVLRGVVEIFTKSDELASRGRD